MLFSLSPLVAVTLLCSHPLYTLLATTDLPSLAALNWDNFDFILNMSGNKVFWSNRGSVTKPMLKHCVWRNKMKDLYDISSISNQSQSSTQEVLFFETTFRFDLNKVLEKLKNWNHWRIWFKIDQIPAVKESYFLKHCTLTFVVRKRSVCTLKVFYLPQIRSSCLLTSKSQCAPIAKWNFQMN